MMKRATILWMLLAITAGFGLFLLKYEVKSMEKLLTKINHSTLENLQALHVMKAEWGHLNRPSRLEDLGTRLLKFETVKPTEYVLIRDLPFSPQFKQGKRKKTQLAASKSNPPAVDHSPPLNAKNRRKQ